MSLSSGCVLPWRERHDRMLSDLLGILSLESTTSCTVICALQAWSRIGQLGSCCRSFVLLHDDKSDHTRRIPKDQIPFFWHEPAKHKTQQHRNSKLQNEYLSYSLKQSTIVLVHIITITKVFIFSETFQGVLGDPELLSTWQKTSLSFHASHRGSAQKEKKM